MQKKIILGVVAVLIVLGIALYFSYQRIRLNQTETIIEKYLSAVLEVPVTIEKTHIAWDGKSGEFENISIGNPEGFAKDAPAISIGNAIFNLMPNSMAQGGDVSIAQLALDNVVIHLAIQDQNNNLITLLGTLKKRTNEQYQKLITDHGALEGKNEIADFPAITAEAITITNVTLEAGSLQHKNEAPLYVQRVGHDALRGVAMMEVTGAVLQKLAVESLAGQVPSTTADGTPAPMDADAIRKLIEGFIENR